jgi:serine protease
VNLLRTRCIPLLLAALSAGVSPAFAQRLFWSPAGALVAPRSGGPRFGPVTTGEVVVRFGEGLPEARRDVLARAFGCQIERSDPASGYALVRVRDGRTAEFMAVLGGRPEVLHAEPAYRLFTTARSLYNPYEWYLFNRGASAGRSTSDFGIQAASTWRRTRGAGVTVAVVDSGVAYEDYGSFAQAPALAAVPFAPGYNAVDGTDHPNDDAGHGTFVTGVLASNLVDGGGVQGVASAVTVMPVKVMGSDGSGTDYDIATGIRWAADHGAQVINLSLGGPEAGRVLADAVAYAASKDCVLVASSGNENAAQVAYPAGYVSCIAVGAIQFDGARAPYSNQGTKLEVVAPGGNLNQDLNQDGAPDGLVAQTFDPQQGYGEFNYAFADGTSGAAPLVSGVAALVRAVNPALSAADVRAAIRTTAFPLGAAGRNTEFGYGLVDALGAVQAAVAAKSTGG